MESFSSSVSTVPSFEDVFTYNMWNPLLDFFSLEQTSSVLVPYFEEASGTVTRGIFILVRHHCHQTFLVTTRTRMSGMAITIFLGRYDSVCHWCCKVSAGLLVTLALTSK